MSGHTEARRRLGVVRPTPDSGPRADGTPTRSSATPGWSSTGGGRGRRFTGHGSRSTGFANGKVPAMNATAVAPREAPVGQDTYRPGEVADKLGRAMQGRPITLQLLRDWVGKEWLPRRSTAGGHGRFDVAVVDRAEVRLGLGERLTPRWWESDPELNR